MIRLYQSRTCLSSSLNYVSRRLFSAETEVVDSILKIVSSESGDRLEKKLKPKDFLLSDDDLIYLVLKKLRLSNSDPLKALDFYYYTSQRNRFYHTSFSLHTMLYILGRNRRFAQIWEVLIDARTKAPRFITNRTLAVVLGRIAHACSVRMTLEAFWKFRKFVPEFDTESFNVLFRVLCQEKSVSDARNAYRRLKRGFTPNLQTFNILLSGWKSGRDAEEFFEEMRAVGVEPDIVSYNCLVDAYCKGNEVEKALAVIERMRDEGISPDVITYTSIIGGLGSVGQPERARSVLSEMREVGCYPDAAAYNATIRNFCIAKRVGDAYSVMDEMVHQGLSPNANTFNLFLRVFNQWNELGSSWDLYQRMMRMGCLPSTQSCLFLMRLFKRQEKVDLALQLWGDMVEKGFGSYSSVSDILIDLLCDMGKVVEAEKCMLEMVEKGYAPSHVSFKRVKVLMELANKHDSIRNLEEKMPFGKTNNQPHEDEDVECSVDLDLIEVRDVKV